MLQIVCGADQSSQSHCEDITAEIAAKSFARTAVSKR
jgi:hypothetical protein